MHEEASCWPEHRDPYFGAEVVWTGLACRMCLATDFRGAAGESLMGEQHQDPGIFARDGCGGAGRCVLCGDAILWAGGIPASA